MKKFYVCCLWYRSYGLAGVPYDWFRMINTLVIRQLTLFWISYTVNVLKLVVKALIRLVLVERYGLTLWVLGSGTSFWLKLLRTSFLLVMPKFLTIYYFLFTFRLDILAIEIGKFKKAYFGESMDGFGQTCRFIGKSTQSTHLRSVQSCCKEKNTFFMFVYS